MCAVTLMLDETPKQTFEVSYSLQQFLVLDSYFQAVQKRTIFWVCFSESRLISFAIQ
jgi:hypothetical protein